LDSELHCYHKACILTGQCSEKRTDIPGSNGKWDHYPVHVAVLWVLTRCSDVVGYPSFWEPWRRRQHEPPKRRYTTITLHCVTTQKRATWIFIAVKSSDLVELAFYQLHETWAPSSQVLI